MKNFLSIVLLGILLNACAPKVGSPEWCKAMDKKAKSDITLNEAKNYAEHCIFK